MAVEKEKFKEINCNYVRNLLNVALSENLEPYGNTAIYVQGTSHFKEVSLEIV